MKEIVIGLQLSIKELPSVSRINLLLLRKVRLKMESDQNRTFNGANLKKLADGALSGKYESCAYSKSGNVITLTYYWR